MIWESWPWKCYLATQAKQLARRERQKRWNWYSLSTAEREIFMCAYAMRKLIESNKISDEVESTQLKALRYEWRGVPIDFTNRYDIDDTYDLTASEPTSILLRLLCNEIIHSYVFALDIGERKNLAGFFVASERNRYRRLLQVSLNEVLRAVTLVSEDDICHLEVRRGGIGGETRIVVKSNRPRK